MLAKLRPAAGPPTFVALPEIICDDKVNEYPALNGGFLGDRYAPLMIEGTAESGKFRQPPLALLEGVSAERLAGRRRLLDELGMATARSTTPRTNAAGRRACQQPGCCGAAGLLCSPQ